MRLLVAVDLTHPSDHVIQEALRLCEPKAEILLVHVVVDLRSIVDVYVCDKPLPALEDLELDGKAKLQQLVQEHRLAQHCLVKELLLTGTPWREIVDCATRHRVDLLVLGTHTDEKPEHRVLGSTASRIATNPPCTILLVPPENAAKKRLAVKTGGVEQSPHTPQREPPR